MRNRLTILPIIAALLILGAAVPAAAQETGFGIEVFGGIYMPDELDKDHDVWGGRFSYRFNDHFGLQTAVSTIDLEDEAFGRNVRNLRFDLFLVDASFQWYPGGRGFYLFGGPGWATIDLEYNLQGNNNDITASDDIFTVHAGLGYEWLLGQHAFIKPQALARHFEGDSFQVDRIDSYEGLDTELTLAVGYRF